MEGNGIAFKTLSYFQCPIRAEYYHCPTETKYFHCPIKKYFQHPIRTKLECKNGILSKSPPQKLIHLPISDKPRPCNC